MNAYEAEQEEVLRQQACDAACTPARCEAMCDDVSKDVRPGIPLSGFAFTFAALAVESCGTGEVDGRTSRRALALAVTTQVSRYRKLANFG